MMCCQVKVPRAGASAELELYPVHVKLLRYQLSGQRQPNANMFAGMVGSIGGMMSSKHRHTHLVAVFFTQLGNFSSVAAASFSRHFWSTTTCAF